MVLCRREKHAIYTVMLLVFSNISIEVVVNDITLYLIHQQPQDCFFIFFIHRNGREIITERLALRTLLVVFFNNHNILINICFKFHLYGILFLVLFCWTAWHYHLQEIKPVLMVYSVDAIAFKCWKYHIIELFRNYSFILFISSLTY